MGCTLLHGLRSIFHPQTLSFFFFRLGYPLPAYQAIRLLCTYAEFGLGCPGQLRRLRPCAARPSDLLRDEDRLCDRPGSLRDSQLSPTTIGVLYPGELGSTFAKLLVEAAFGGHHSRGRSLRTREVASHDAGLNVLTPSSVLNCAPIVISFGASRTALSAWRRRCVW